MKALLLVLLLGLAGVGAYYFYFRDKPFAWSQGPELAAASPGASGRSAATGPKDFKALDAALQADMDHVPANLHAPRQMPTHALETRTRLTPYVQLHAEYQTLTDACDVIIAADQAFAEHQERCGFAAPPPGPGAPARLRTSGPAPAIVLEQQQALWDNQRQQADGKVRQLLATLENRRL